jgi:hypothetical protein
MRAIATTLFVIAVLAFPAASASSAQTTLDLQRIVDDTVARLPIQPPELPVTPPPLPAVEPPALPLPTPVPTPVPVPVPEVVPEVVPAATAQPAQPEARDASTAGEPAARAAADQAAPAQERSTAPAGSTPRTTTRSGRARTAPRPAGSRQSSRSAASERRSPSPPGRARAVRTVGSTLPATSPAPAEPRASAGPPSFASRVADEVGELVRRLPPAILWALVGVALIALALGANAFWQSRQRRALEAQREELLDDIGLLSRALLPPVPQQLAGVAVSAAYRPADGPAAGGDFYDVFAIDAPRIGILLGDVSGHGRESVTQAALARYTLRTLLAAGLPPAEALARADALLARELAGSFVTVIAGVYDSDTLELTYAKAGHAPPIVLGAAHDPDAEQPAPPIGLSLGDAWPEFRVRIGEGVSVCLFTDGLEDARVAGSRIGRDEIARLLAAQGVPEAGRLLADLGDLADLMPDDAAAVVLSHADPPPADVEPRDGGPISASVL